MKSVDAKILERAKAKGMATVLLQQLFTRFDRLPEDVVERVRIASVEELGHWANRVLIAETLPRVFLDE